MKRLLTILLILGFATTCFGTVVQLSTEQIDNLDVVGTAVKANYPTYSGAHSVKTGIEFDGINDAGLQAFIDGLNIDNLKKDDPKNKERKKVRNKLKSLGFDDDMLNNMGLTNDIPDA